MPSNDRSDKKDVGVTHVTERPFSWTEYTPGCVDGSNERPRATHDQPWYGRVSPREPNGVDVSDAGHPDAPIIERTEIDGVPVFWTPVDGPRVAAIVFRVGRADEPAHQGGITHLVEHLALAPLAQQDYVHNGFVSGTMTVFHASGTDAQLKEFSGSIISSLAALPLERVAMERRILGQEAATRGSNPIGALRWFRYGNVAHGLLGAEEIGLAWLGPEPIDAWAKERFTRSNVAVWWSGPPPADLRLDVPEGRRWPAPSPSSVPGITFPTRADLGGTGVSAGYVAPRSAATRITLDILIRRLRHELRFERGLIYDVISDYDPQDATSAHIALGMDARREDSEAVLSTVLRILDDLYASGSSKEEIKREADDFAQAAGQPAGRLGSLYATVHDELLDRPRETPADVVAEYLSVMPDDVKAAARVALDTLLAFGPPGEYDGGRLTAYPNMSLEVLDGRTVRPSGWVVGPRARKDRLIVGPTGVSHVGAERQGYTVRYADCVALRHWDGPVRQLWGADGFNITIRADEWRGGQKVIDEIDRAVSREVVACQEHGIGSLEVPAT
jgi:zinc protease